MDASSASMEDLLAERAQQLFQLSDHERKGFIVRRDMQRMRSEIPLSPEQLEAVFDSLDVHDNGYLTIEQFLAGFGEFLRSQRRPPSRETQLRSLDEADSGVGMPAHHHLYDDDDPLDLLLAHIDDTRMLSSTDALRQLVGRVRRDSCPVVHGNLERFLTQLGADLARKADDSRQLEAALRAREEAHDKQLQKLFEEMEAQLSEDKENIVRQEERRLRVSQAALREQLRQKEDQLQEALSGHQQLADSEAKLSVENSQLRRAKVELEQRLSTQREENIRLQRTLEGYQREQTKERSAHIATGFRLAWAIMLEHHGLLQQLHMVRRMADTIISNHASPTKDHKNENYHTQVPETRRTTLPQKNSDQTSSTITVGSLDDYEYDEEFYRIPSEKFDIGGSSLEPVSIASTSSDKMSINTISLQEEMALSMKTKGSPWSPSETEDNMASSNSIPSNSLCVVYSILNRRYDFGNIFSFSFHEFGLLSPALRYICLSTLLKCTTCVVIAYIFMLIFRYKCDAS